MHNVNTNFNGYLQSSDELGNMSIVEWWGVSAIFLFCETLRICIIFYNIKTQVPWEWPNKERKIDILGIPIWAWELYI
jgi:hypothetical protein